MVIRYEQLKSKDCEPTTATTNNCTCVRMHYACTRWAVYKTQACI